MKKIDQIREQYDLITEKEEAETRKLTSLVRAGLFDPKKLPMLKRALNKDPKDMTPAERKILIELLDSLMAEVLQSQQVYSKVKQNVMMKEENLEEVKGADNYYSKYDPRYTKMPTDREIPTIIILKRKAIRIYPDNQKVALYYSQALDKYVTIPFGTFGDAPMNEAVVIGDDDEEDKKDYGYQMKKSYTKYKNKDDHKNIIRMKGELDSMKRKMASGGYKEGKSKQTAAQTISSREAALKKLKQKAPQEKVTKTVPGGDPSKLSKGNFKKLMKGIDASDDNFATRLGTKIGLKARRAVDKTVAAGSDKINHTFEETETKSKFYAKRKQQVDENSVSKFTYDDLDDFSVSSVAKDLAPVVGTARSAERTKRAYQKRQYGSMALHGIDTALSGLSDVALASGVGAPVKAGYSAIKGAIIGSKAASKLATKGAEKAAAATAVKAPAKTATPEAPKAPETPKAPEVTEPPKAAEAPKAPEAPKATETPKAPETAETPKTVEPPKAAETPKATEAPKKEPTKAAEPESKPPTKEPAKAEVPPAKPQKGSGRSSFAKWAGRAAKVGGAAADVISSLVPSEINKSYTAPKEFGLQAKTSKPKSDVRTTVQARDTSLYRKSMQAEESNSTISVVKSYTPPKEFSLAGKIRAKQSKGSVRTSVDTRDTIQYRKSLQQNESVLNTLYNIKESEEKAIEIANESVVINNAVANKIIGLYESVNKNNKEKIETMLNESVDSFKKIASFAARQ